MASLAEQLAAARRQAEALLAKTQTLKKAEEGGLKITPQTTVQQAEAFIASPPPAPAPAPAPTLDADAADLLRDVGIDMDKPTGVATSDPATAPADVDRATDAKAKDDQIADLTRDKKLKDLRDALGIAEPPTAAGLAGLRKDLTTKAGIADIEDDIADLEGRKLALADEFKKFGHDVFRGQDMRIAARRLGEEGRRLTEILDGLEREELVLSRKLANKNTTIDQIMKYTQQDFQNALSAYSAQYKAAIDLHNILDEEEDDLVKDAKANLQILSDSIRASIQAGKMTADAITDQQKEQIAQLEQQAGIPKGATLALIDATRPDEKQVYTKVDDNGTLHHVTSNPDGSLNVRTVEDVDTPKGGAPFLTRDWFTSTFTMDQLKDQAKASGFTRGGGFLGFGVGPEGVEDYLNYVEESIKAYREAGFSDKDILKMMQK